MEQKEENRNPLTHKVSVVNIGLEQDVIKNSIELLNKILSDEFTLYLKTRKYHWNIQGPMFNDLHSFFEELYDELNIIVDEVAERIKQLGGNAEATMAEYRERTGIMEDPGVYPSDKEMVKSTLESLESIIVSIRKGLDATEEHEDSGTAHFLVDIMLKHEKKAWMLRSMLHGWD